MTRLLKSQPDRYVAAKFKDTNPRKSMGNFATELASVLRKAVYVFCHGVC